MNRNVLIVAGGCAVLLVVCAVCIAGMVVLNVPGKLDQALSSVQLTPGAQAAATLAPKPGTLPTQTAGVASSGRTKGNPNAPIAFVDYSDFQ